MKGPKSRATASEEFSVEFGDVNGTKLYEFPFTSSKKQEKKPNINKK